MIESLHNYLKTSKWTRWYVHQLFWRLLTTEYEKELVDKTNLIVLWCHYNLLRIGKDGRGMKNIGLGEDVSLPEEPEQDDTQEEEVLPSGWYTRKLVEGWNNSLPCQLCYLYDKTLYLLTVHPADDDGFVIIKLMRPLDNKLAVSGMNLNEITKLKGRLDEVMPNWRTIQDRLYEELIEPFVEDILCETDSPPNTSPPSREV